MPGALDAEGIAFKAGQSRMGNIRLRWTLSSANAGSLGISPSSPSDAGERVAALPAIVRALSGLRNLDPSASLSRRRLWVADHGGLTLLAVGTTGAKVVIVLRALGRASVSVGTAPGIERHCITLEIRTIPILGACWPFHQRRKSLFGRGIGAHIQIIQVEYARKSLDGLLGYGQARPAQLAQRRRCDQADEESDDGDDHQYLEKRETGLTRIL